MTIPRVSVILRGLFAGWLALTVGAVSTMAQPVFVDVKPFFDTDTLLEPGGTPLSPPLDANRERMDGQTLPAAYSDTAAWSTVDGKGIFMFGSLKKSGLDGMGINGQTLNVPPGKYGSIDLALLSAPDGYGSPFSSVTFRYVDGTSAAQRFGPVPGWVASPTALDNTYYNFTDNSGVTSLIDFAADWGPDEAQYLVDSSGNGNANGVRFVDGTGLAVYALKLPQDVTNATLGVTVGNNFVISLASAYADPYMSRDAYTEVANSMKIYNNFEHRSLGNLKLYEFSLKPFLTNGTGEVYLMFTDATPANGWGPYIQHISVYTGTNRIFAQDILPTVVTNGARVFASFRTDGGDAEKPFLYDNSGSGPSNRKHRFADGNGSITYGFDLPDDVTDANVMVDMANNFVVSINGPLSITRYAQVTPGSANEKDYLVDDGNSVLGGNYRFADASAYMLYQFDLADTVTNAVAQVSVGNQFVIEVRSGTSGDFIKERDYVAETGNEIRDNSNLKVYEVQLDRYLTNNATKVVQIRLSDGQPVDGWGPYLTGITIVDRAGTTQPQWTKVLDSQAMYGLDVHNELNKGYYTIDLSPVLKTNNPKKEAFIRFKDGSTGDGWGPGIFWMAAYSGNLDVQTDGLVFSGVKAMNSDPEGFGINLLRRRYTLDSAKSLQSVTFPAAPTNSTTRVYLLAATANPGAAEPVKLSISRASQGGNVVLSWPASSGSYVVESTGSLSGTWTKVEGTVVSGPEAYSMTVPISGSAMYFRLRQ